MNGVVGLAFWLAFAGLFVWCAIATRRLLHAIEEERLELIRLAEARDRGPITTNDPRGTA